ncbi:MAG: LPS export ABC transporter permease LptG [Sphingomonadales bacterium]
MTFFPSRTISWYVARMFLLRTLAFIIGLVVILESLDLLGESGKILAAKGNGEADLWVYVSLRVPQLIQLFLPFSVLLATLVTLATLNQNSEVVIFKAAGLSAHQILSPLLVAALGVAVLNLGFNETVTTRARRQLKHWQDHDYAKVPMDMGPGGENWVRDGNTLFHADAVAGLGRGMTITGLTVFQRRADKLETIIMAGSARPGDRIGLWQLRDVRLFDVASGRESRQPAMALSSKVVPRQFTVAPVNPNFVAIWRLWPQIAEQRAAGKNTDRLEVAGWHKLVGPLSCLLMPLLGSVAAFGLARSGRLFVRAVIGMALGFAFFVADNFMVAMGNFGTVPPLMAAWSPFLLFLLIGEAVLLRTEE